MNEGGKYGVEVLLGEALDKWASLQFKSEEKKLFDQAVKREGIGEDDFGMLCFEIEEAGVVHFKELKLVTDELVKEVMGFKVSG